MENINKYINGEKTVWRTGTPYNEAVNYIYW